VADHVVIDTGFETAVTYGIENATVNIPYARNSWGSYDGAFTVCYHTKAVTAVEGSDYIAHPVGSKLEFAAGINTQNINVIIVDDSIADPWKAFTIEIDSITPSEGGVTVNVDTSSHTVFIVDTDPSISVPDSSEGGVGDECMNIADRWNEVGNMATGIFMYDFNSSTDEGTVCYISGWLENNIGELNTLINTCYSGSSPGLGLEEEAIYRHIFLKNHYAKLSRNALRGISTSSSSSASSGSSELVMSDWTELRDGDSVIKRVATTASPATKADASRIYKSFADSSGSNVKELVYKYNLYHAVPSQVAGKDAP
tara:strand:+ start:338 stop:1276 length:939 start_codon:yes stop_codon:yes gene_type:complete